MAGDTHELAERLAVLGLEPREARLYLHLCARGPVPAGEAAAQLGLKRTETYRALESLVERGFAVAQLGRPVLYEATPPETVFAQVAERHERERAQVEAARESLLRALAETRARDASQEGRYAFRILQGRRAILHATATMLHGMRVGQSMVSTYFGPANATAQNQAYRETLRRAAEGLPMRFLLREQPGMEDAMRPLAAGPQVRIRHFQPAHPLRMTIVDAREVLVWLVNDPSPRLDARNDVAMWTNAPDFVKAQTTLYEALWANARDAPG